MSHCYVLDCDMGWEEHVSFELRDFGVEHWIAMESKSFRLGRRGGMRVGIEVPMLPGTIFVWGDLLELLSLRRKIDHVDEIWADQHGIPVYVPQNDLERFRSEVEAYLAVCRESIAKGHRPPAKPSKLAINLGDLKDPRVRERVMHKLGFAESEAA